MAKGYQPIPLRWVKDGDCIRAISHLSRDGYPRIGRNKKRQRIGRIILFRRYGTQPHGIVARHTCDHKWCINPDHIIPGKQADNVHDMIGRLGHGSAKINAEHVREIRKSNLRQIDIASFYGISQSQVSAIRLGISWKHVQKENQ